MILSAGLSPAWQHTLHFEGFTLGEVNRARLAHWCASGKVINVAIAASRLGAEAAIVTAIGGVTGDAIQREIGVFGIQAEWIHTPEPTRVCTTLLDGSGQTTELVENVAPVSEAVLEDFVDRVRVYAGVSRVTVITGSLPEKTPDEYYARLMQGIPAKFLLDIRGAGLKHCLPLAPFVVKPNREELQATVGRSLTGDAELLKAMRELNDAGAAWAVVSDGARGAWVSSENVAAHLKPPRVHLVNPIGCGDSLAAGIAAFLQEHDDVLEGVRFGMGAAAHNAELPIPARIDLERSLELADLVEITMY